jgi:hypothetical protein
MKSALRTIIAFAAIGFAPYAPAEQTEIHFLRFPAIEADTLGQIDKIVVKVSCSWISALKNLPELYNIEMGYEMPTENVLEASPRLGAAAVELQGWNGVIGVRVPPNADAKSCFEVTVTVEGRTGAKRKWKGRQLGFEK